MCRNRDGVFEFDFGLPDVLGSSDEKSYIAKCNDNKSALEKYL